MTKKVNKIDISIYDLAREVFNEQLGMCRQSIIDNFNEWNNICFFAQNNAPSEDALNYVQYLCVERIKKALTIKIQKIIAPKKSIKFCKTEIHEYSLMFGRCVADYIAKQRQQICLTYALSEKGSQDLLNQMERKLQQQASHELSMWVCEKKLLPFCHSISFDSDKTCQPSIFIIPFDGDKTENAFALSYHCTIPDVLALHDDTSLRRLSEAARMFIIAKQDGYYFHATYSTLSGARIEKTPCELLHY